MGDNELLMPRELRELLRVPTFTVYRIGRQDLIPGATVRIGRFMRFRRSVVEEWIRAGGSMKGKDQEPEPAGVA